MPYETAILLAAHTAVVATVVSGLPAAQAAERNGVYEMAMKSTRAYANPSADAEVRVEFTSPGGKQSSAYAFWDGGDVWRVRFSPTVTGRWRWRSHCSDKENKGLHGREGTFDCEAYKGSNTLQNRGPIKLSANRRYLTCSDGTPFFWLADTAWNGVLKARPEHWERYLSTRRSQGFTAVQFVATHWRAYEGAPAFTGKNNIRINPDFFRPLDAKVRAINDHGMVAAPVILWAFRDNDPGYALGNDDAIRLARYIVARWGAYNVLWILGGDGDYRGERAERWKKIGRAVFGDHPDRPATMHPGGQSWVAEEFRREPWYSMIGYQSGHSLDGTRWLVEGPPATEWDKSPTLPIVNLEPNYEGILVPETRKPFDALAVRKALYRSLLVAPTAGVTYGHHGIWSWAEKPEVPLAHAGTGTAPPWDQALTAEGAKSVKHLARLFASIRWWMLRPDPALVTSRPSDPLLSVLSARSEDGGLALIYLPDGGQIELDAGKLKLPLPARWFSPSSGRYSPAGRIATSSATLRPPSDGDWVLVVGR